MKSMRRVFASLAVAALLPVAAAADPTAGSCSPTAVHYVASGGGTFQTVSSSYVDLPQARVIFHQGGSKPSCVLVRFSADPKAGNFTNMGFRVLLDGAQAGLPFEAQISDGIDVAPSARRFTFIFANVAPGAHSVQMQHQATSPNSAAAMNGHNTIVWHAR
jgi:hypothetical protein